MPMQKVMTLESVISGSQSEPRHTVRLWVDMLRALAEKHRAGTFFGTANPQSVLIDMKNYILLTDAPFDPESPYLAPEILAGMKPDEQTDIYSFGVMLFEMLTGSLEGLHEKPPSRMSDNVPRWIDPIVLRCIMKQRSLRFLDLEELSSALGKIKSNIGAVYIGPPGKKPAQE
jgi:serine/threonine-protein kinase